MVKAGSRVCFVSRVSGWKFRHGVFVYEYEQIDQASFRGQHSNDESVLPHDKAPARIGKGAGAGAGARCWYGVQVLPS